MTDHDMTENFFDYDVAEFLDNDELIAEYLTAAFEENNSDYFIQAINNVIRAKGMTNIAKATGLNRESLYKSFKVGAKPRYETVVRVLTALGVQLQFKTS